MVCFQSTPASVGRSLWIRSCGNRKCSRRATVRLGIDKLIANTLVYSASAVDKGTVQKSLKQLLWQAFSVVVEFELASRCYRLLYWNLKVSLNYKLPDHSIVFARWLQQHKDAGRVTLGFAVHFQFCVILFYFSNVQTVFSPICVAVIVMGRTLYLCPVVPFIFFFYILSFSLA